MDQQLIVNKKACEQMVQLGKVGITREDPWPLVIIHDVPTLDLFFLELKLRLVDQVNGDLLLGENTPEGWNTLISSTQITKENISNFVLALEPEKYFLHEGIYSSFFEDEFGSPTSDQVRNFLVIDQLLTDNGGLVTSIHYHIAQSKELKELKESSYVLNSPRSAYLKAEKSYTVKLCNVHTTRTDYVYEYEKLETTTSRQIPKGKGRPIEFKQVGSLPNTPGLKGVN
jgi:hypothetical protein